MKTLSPDWFARYPVDFEYSRWILLDYLSDAYSNFKSSKLFPYFQDINYHITNLESWDNKREFFKGELKGLDFEKMTLLYDAPESIINIDEINSIVKYSIDEMRSVSKKGRIIWQKAEAQFKWHVIGIVPTYKLEGYIFVRIDAEVTIYRYTIGSIIIDDSNYGSISLDEIGKEEWGLGVYEYLKMKLIKERELPNPLTISVEGPNLPFSETIFPMIKRLSLIKIHNI
jgi:hypothetical protein